MSNDRDSLRSRFCLLYLWARQCQFELNTLISDEYTQPYQAYRKEIGTLLYYLPNLVQLPRTWLGLGRTPVVEGGMA